MNKTIHSKRGAIFCEMLAATRKESGLTQRELAKRLKRAHTFVSKCELGERRTDLIEFYWICRARRYRVP